MKGNTPPPPPPKRDHPFLDASPSPTHPPTPPHSPPAPTLEQAYTFPFLSFAFPPTHPPPHPPTHIRKGLFEPNRKLLQKFGDFLTAKCSAYLSPSFFFNPPHLPTPPDPTTPPGKKTIDPRGCMPSVRVEFPLPFPSPPPPSPTLTPYPTLVSRREKPEPLVQSSWSGLCPFSPTTTPPPPPLHTTTTHTPPPLGA